MVGDVDFEDVKDKVLFCTPVPGGVGPMTIAMLMKQTVDASINKLTKNNINIETVNNLNFNLCNSI